MIREDAPYIVTDIRIAPNEIDFVGFIQRNKKGRDIKDCLNIQTSMGKTCIAFVTRKPSKESIVHECVRFGKSAALRIDQGRIPTQDKLGEGMTSTWKWTDTGQGSSMDYDRAMDARLR